MKTKNNTKVRQTVVVVAATALASINNNELLQAYATKSDGNSVTKNAFVVGTGTRQDSPLGLLHSRAFIPRGGASHETDSPNNQRADLPKYKKKKGSKRNKSSSASSNDDTSSQTGDIPPPPPPPPPPPIDDNDLKAKQAYSSSHHEDSEKLKSHGSKTTNKEQNQSKQQKASSATNSSKNDDIKDRHHHNDTDDKKAETSQSKLPQIATQIINESNYYKILGLNPSEKSKLTVTQIRKAYRRVAVQTHPDKIPNGDRRAFDKVAEAYDVLSDESKKSIYDQFGLQGLKNNYLGSGGNRFDMGSNFHDHILRSFFGQHNPFSDTPFQDGRFGSNTSSGFSRYFQSPRNRDLKYQLEVSLEDLYNGAHHQVAISTQQHHEFSNNRSKQKIVDVSIPKGASSGQTIRLSGEVDHVVDATPADVIFVLVQKKHDIFVRKGNDLAMEMNISLREALCGFEKTITHLDGRKIILRSPRVETFDDANRPSMIRMGDVHVLKGEGMPRRQRSRMSSSLDDRTNLYGDMYIQYKIDIPSFLSSPNRIRIDQILSQHEREMLGKLLDKLEGINSSATMEKIQKSTHDITNIQQLKESSASDFGVASGLLDSGEYDEDEHLNMEDENNTGNSSFQYFTSSDRRNGSQFFTHTSTSSVGGRSGFFTNFSSHNGEEDGDSNVQCQQM